ncbi:GNAT family N-acetyltransferase [Tengunoibacter tsumagoiensis]|uniref:Acetyltransferase n=1 Tax=Tengunoibacter tsumagoiensis TaxID=2014871 RepID=A0A401ZWA0_9CHLR|nr:GNAT family N-acetyltransferase [Tengunoibacter tsumagoiensis]GCE11175.1 acetyltransferase [Tengunoibacter tsumagoiensis]
MYIHTAKLLLRDFTDNDFTAIHAFDADPELRRYCGGGVASENDTRAFLHHALIWQASDPRPVYALALIRKEDDQMIGVVGLSIVNPDLGEAELWYRLSRFYWKQGYMTEAVQALIAFSFQTLYLHRIYAQCAPENQAARRVLEKVGLRLEGLLKENAPHEDGTWRDSQLYAILASEWAEHAF